MPGFREVGMPKDVALPGNTVRLDALDLPRTEAHPNAAVAAGPPVQVTTVRSLGGFSASIPVKPAQALTGAGWVLLRLRVTSGRIGYASFNRRTGIISRTTALARGSEPRDLVLAVPDLSLMDRVVVFNEADDEISKVEIVDAAVLVTRPGDH
jgi:hypothetical protein